MQIPFELYIRIVPNVNDNRQAKFHDLNKASILVYNGISSIPGVNLARPSGGNYDSRSTYMSSAVAGAAFKPSFGNVPHQIMVGGFYEVVRNDVAIHPEMQIISGGSVYSGSSSHLYYENENSVITNEVISFRSAIDTSLSVLDTNYVYNVHKLLYNGILYGDRGLHFPK